MSDRAKKLVARKQRKQEEWTEDEVPLFQSPSKIEDIERDDDVTTLEALKALPGLLRRRLLGEAKMEARDEPLDDGTATVYLGAGRDPVELPARGEIGSPAELAEAEEALEIARRRPDNPQGSARFEKRIIRQRLRRGRPGESSDEK